MGWGRGGGTLVLVKEGRAASAGPGDSGQLESEGPQVHQNPLSVLRIPSSFQSPVFPAHCPTVHCFSYMLPSAVKGIHPPHSLYPIFASQCPLITAVGFSTASEN